MKVILCPYWVIKIIFGSGCGTVSHGIMGAVRNVKLVTKKKLLVHSMVTIVNSK